MRVLHPEQIKEFLIDNRHRLENPSCYIGQEPNTFHKDWDEEKLRILIAAPYPYEQFRGNQTIPLLYQMINEWREDVICERAYFPNTLRDYRLFTHPNHRIPIFGLESKRSMGEYDIIMTSLSYLPPWINFPLMLDMSGIPPFRQDRENGNEDYPLIMVGGLAMFGNFSIAYPVVDMIYLGDAEPGLFPILEDILDGRDLEYLQKKYDYIFCPRFYSPSYEGKKFSGWSPEEGCPDKLKVIRCKDLDKAPMLTKPIPSYTDATMGLGEIELSRGCRAYCAYCGLGWKNRPYRERSVEKMVEGMKENKVNSGTYKGLCPIAAEFAFYSEKRRLVAELLKVSRKVDPLSMRVDAFINDVEFDEVLAEIGMNNVALGVEGISQRQRNRLLKGITEEDIFKACKIAIDTGFKTVKLFLISNIGETEEDYEEFFSLLKRVVIYKESNASKTNIKVSWTPLFVEPCTPLQWKKPTIEQSQDWKWICKRLDGLGVKYPKYGGGKNEPNLLWVMQGMHLGDVRFARALVKTTLEVNKPFYTAFGKNMKDVLSKYMEDEGISWDYILREKDKDEIFPWDIVDRGVKKEALRNLYNKIESGKFDSKSIPIKVKTDDYDISDIKEPASINREEDAVYWYLIKYAVSPDYEVVPNTHLTALFHRAMMKSGFPLAATRMTFFSDRNAQNWYGGYDFFLCGVTRKLSEDDVFALNIHTEPNIRFLSYQFIGTKSKQILKKYVGLYDVVTDIDIERLEERIEDFENREDVFIRSPEARYFSGLYQKKVNLKSQDVYYEFGDIRAIKGMRYGRFIVKLNAVVGIRYFLKGVLNGVSFSRILRFEVNKIEFHEKIENEKRTERIM